MTEFITNPYDPRANNATFDFQGYMIGINKILDRLRPELPQGVTNPLDLPEVRRRLTRVDPLLFAVLYLPHLIKMDPSLPADAEGNITFADLHLELCRYALTWRFPVEEPRAARDVFIAPRDCGKALSLDTPVLTVSRGWTTHGELVPGDQVFDDQGQPTTVIATRSWNDRPRYRLTFSDGESIVADAEHEWVVGDRYSDRPPQMITTEKIARRWLLTNRRGWNEVRYAVAMTEPLNYPEAELPISPYTYGAWLGDGHSTGGRFTSDDSEIVERIRAEGQDVVQYDRPYAYGLPGFITKLRNADQPILSVAKNYTPKFAKTILPIYQQASIEQRLQLLQGLMDTDGSIDAKGRCEFMSTSKVLAEDVLALVRGLGIKATLSKGRATLYGVDKGPKYRIMFHTTLPVFHLSRKLAKIKTKLERASRRQIVNVEQIENGPTNCIQVDAPSHLYLAGRTLIPTHNSTWLFANLPIWALAHRHIDFIAAFSSAGPQATRHLSAIKNEFDTNLILRTDFPDLCNPMKRQGGQSVADTQKMYFSRSKQTIAAAGLDEEILGLTDPMKRRPQLLILDDIEPGEENYSLHQVEKRRIAVRDTILPMNERAHTVLVGTVTMLGSLMHQLVQTVTENREPEDWIAEERFQVHYFDPIPDGTRSIWAEKWPLKYLLSIAHMRSFKKNFLNQPVPEDTAYWQESTFRYGSFPCFKELIQIDPATTKTATSDFYGITVIGYARAKRDPHTGAVTEPARCLVRYARAFRASPAEIRRRVVDLISIFDHVGRVRIEVNQGGDTWKEVFRNLPVPLMVHTESVKKDVRAADLLAHYERGEVWHERKLPELEQQQLAFPNVVHDDLVDAVGAGVRYFLERKRRKAGVRRGTYV